MGFFKSKEEKERIKEQEKIEFEKEFNEKIKESLEMQELQKIQDSQDVVRCPKCGSTQITAGNKGFSTGKAIVGDIIAGPVGLVAGAIGSKKTIITCLKCGHKWQAGKK